MLMVVSTPDVLCDEITHNACKITYNCFLKYPRKMTWQRKAVAGGRAVESVKLP